MAIPLSMQLPVIPLRPVPKLRLKPISLPYQFTLRSGNPLQKKSLFVIKSVEEGRTSSENVTSSSEETTEPGGDELAELGKEVKMAMMEEKKDKEVSGDLSWSGVAEEVGEIEWPAFGKVLGTTGVVLGVIAGSSVVLLTVNAVLAELSESVFAGKGVQDFFG